MPRKRNVVILWERLEKFKKDLKMTDRLIERDLIGLAPRTLRRWRKEGAVSPDSYEQVKRQLDRYESEPGHDPNPETPETLRQPETMYAPTDPALPSKDEMKWDRAGLLDFMSAVKNATSRGWIQMLIIEEAVEADIELHPLFPHLPFIVKVIERTHEEPRF